MEQLSVQEIKIAKQHLGLSHIGDSRGISIDDKDCVK